MSKIMKMALPKEPEILKFFNNLQQISLLPFANSHMVNFITHNLFEKFLSKPIQEEINNMDINDLNRVVLSNISIGLVNQNSVKAMSECNSLIEFLSQIPKLSLKQIDACVSLEKLLQQLQSKHSEYRDQFIKNLMSVKKSHEVEIMSGLIAALAKSEGCSHIVDVGGGKGYLSSVLALEHELKVLSIDSSSITSKGAEKRIPKVEKLWNNLRKKSSTNKSGNTNGGQIDKQTYSQLCKYVTHFISAESNVKELLSDHFQRDTIGKVLLVGLHTCGNLAASSLQLFKSHPEHVRCLVNAGCCYHLIVEEFDTDQSWLSVNSQDHGFGFPMSAFLRHKRFVLGRNARMLAAQAPDRVSSKGKLETEVLFYRALLEVYLEKNLNPTNGPLHLKVGKMGKKCLNFIDYVHKSIERLGLNIKVDDQELQQLYDAHSQTRKQLHAYFLLRLAVAPIIEAAVMLDRLLYLQEQGIENAYLTQLFDPVVSPRCYAIVAFNNSDESSRIS